MEFPSACRLRPSHQARRECWPRGTGYPLTPESREHLTGSRFWHDQASSIPALPGTAHCQGPITQPTSVGQPDSMRLFPAAPEGPRSIMLLPPTKPPRASDGDNDKNQIVIRILN
ncbi:hypothetical protein VTJ04DRAFT_8202 [Mycothermus thermophilus]|uniref:uncharacterized protein n=1 Tax=Humicola insolens TaxID=85995 RepID=UPI0037443E79